MAKFSFRWGVSLFDNARTEIPNLILKHYHQVPITNIEMMFILHLASFKYESEKGAAKPSLTKTLRERMGYKTNQGIINVEQALVKRGLLIVHKSPGKRSEYDFGPLSEKIIAIATLDPSTKIDDYPSTKIDDYPSTKIDDYPSTKIDDMKKKREERKFEEEKGKKESPPHLSFQELAKSALIVYSETADLKLDKTQAAAITDLIKLGDFDLARWTAACTSTKLGGVKPGNVQCRIDTYKAGGDYQKLISSRHNSNGPPDPAIKPATLNPDQLAAFEALQAEAKAATTETAARVNEVMNGAQKFGIDIDRETKKVKRRLKQ